MNKVVYLHVGFPKTGTTTFQKNIFPHVENVRYLGRNYIGSDLNEGLKKLRFDLVWKSLNHPDWQVVKVSDYFGNCSYSSSLLISDEFIISQGMVPQVYDCFMKEGSVNESLLKFRKVCNNSGYEIIAFGSLRRQDFLLERIYAQMYPEYLQHYKIKTVDYLADWVISRPHSEFYNLLNYNNFYQSLIDLFGEQNVLLLPFELLNRDSAQYFRKLDSFTGLDIGKRYNSEKRENVRGDYSAGVKVRIDPYTVRIKNSLGMNNFSAFGLGKLISSAFKKYRFEKMENATRSRILENWREQNIALSKNFPVFDDYYLNS